jgi:hypothetical protein
VGAAIGLILPTRRVERDDVTLATRAPALLCSERRIFEKLGAEGDEQRNDPPSDDARGAREEHAHDRRSRAGRTRAQDRAAPKSIRDPGVRPGEAKRRKVDLLIRPTAEAIQVFMERPGDTNAILHVTC